jgi:hypothetical protein
MVQMPIGLDYHTISNNPYCQWKSEDESHLPSDQEIVLVNIRKTSKPFYERITKIYVNFSILNFVLISLKEYDDIFVLSFSKHVDA